MCAHFLPRRGQTEESKLMPDPKPPTPAAAQAPPPAAPEVPNRQAKLVFVRNVTKGAIAEFPNGERTIIHSGRIGQISSDRLDALGSAVAPASEADFKKQEKEKPAA